MLAILFSGRAENSGPIEDPRCPIGPLENTPPPCCYVLRRALGLAYEKQCIMIMFSPIIDVDYFNK
jgi:hypothetical protein